MRNDRTFEENNTPGVNPIASFRVKEVKALENYCLDADYERKPWQGGDVRCSKRHKFRRFFRFIRDFIV